MNLFWELFCPAFECLQNNGQEILKLLDHMIVNKPIFTFIVLSIAVAKEYDLQPKSDDALVRCFGSIDEVLDLAYKTQFKITGEYDFDVYGDLNLITKLELCQNLKIIDGTIIKYNWQTNYSQIASTQDQQSAKEELQRTTMQRDEIFTDYEAMLAMADLRKQAAADLRQELMAQEADIAKMKNSLADEEPPQVSV